MLCYRHEDSFERTKNKTARSSKSTLRLDLGAVAKVLAVLFGLLRLHSPRDGPPAEKGGLPPAIAEARNLPY